MDGCKNNVTLLITSYSQKYSKCYMLPFTIKQLPISL